MFKRRKIVQKRIFSEVEGKFHTFLTNEERGGESV